MTFTAKVIFCMASLIPCQKIGQNMFTGTYTKHTGSKTLVWNSRNVVY